MLEAKDHAVRAFLAALSEEIVPFVEQNYPVDVSRRILYGHSGAGMFATCAVFRDPGRFSGYVASSPALWRMGGKLFQFEQTLEGDQPPRGKLYLSVGALEQPSGDERGERFQNVERLEWFAKALEKRAYPDTEIRHTVFPNDTHTTAAGPALAHGVWWTLGRSLQEAAQFWASIPDEVKALLAEARVPRP